MLADATRLPFRDASVDAVLSDLPFGRKHGLKDTLYAEVLRECRRVLKPVCAVYFLVRYTYVCMYV